MYIKRYTLVYDTLIAYIECETKKLETGNYRNGAWKLFD